MGFRMRREAQPPHLGERHEALDRENRTPLVQAVRDRPGLLAHPALLLRPDPTRRLDPLFPFQPPTLFPMSLNVH